MGAVGGGRRAMDRGPWTVKSVKSVKRKTVNHEPWTVGRGQWAVGRGWMDGWMQDGGVMVDG